MTGKETLNSIRNEYYTENERKIVVIDRDDESFDIIEQDLEVLEILKKHISFKIDERQCDKYLIKMVSEDTGNYTYIRLYEEECNKLLEEWLDNDK